MERRRTLLYRELMYKTAAVTAIAAITTCATPAQNPPTPIPPFSVCSQNVNVLSLLPPPAGSAPNPNEDGDTQFENALINSTEASLLQSVANAPSLDLTQQLTLLGKLLIYDKTLSPAQNIGC